MFKTAMEDGTVTILGATTSEEYMRYIIPNKAMDRRMSEVVLHEPSIPKTLTMLRETVYSEWNNSYGVVMTDHSLCRVVEHATAFMRSARPSSAARLAKEAYKVACERAGGNPFAEERLMEELEHVRIDMRSIKDSENMDDPHLQSKIKAGKARERTAVAELEKFRQSQKQVTKDKARLAAAEAEISRLESDLCRPETASDMTNLDRIMEGIARAARTREELKKRLQLRVTIDDVNEALENIAGVRLRDPTPEEYKLAKTIRATLGGVVFGQEPALQAIGRCFGRRILHRGRQRPIGALFFTGPPGTGKSALGEALAVHGFGGKNHLLLINATSFKGSSVRVDLLGGRNTPGKLSEFVATAKTGVILVDEVEKGDYHLHDLFLEMLERGSVLNRETGMEISLTPFFFIFTSNLGARYVRRPAPGSTVPATDEDMVHREIQSKFKREFIERIDRIIIYQHLTGAATVNLFKQHIKSVQDDYLKSGIQVSFSKDASEFLQAKIGKMSGRVAKNELESMLDTLIMAYCEDDYAILKGKSLLVKWSDDETEFASSAAGEGSLLIEELP
jgi:ATP-dependent Clp protease ATP-binding subunit ClpB